MPKIILASTSRYRQEVLRKLNIAFVAMGSNVNETPKPGEKAKQLVERLAREKAKAVFAGRDDFVIGSDQAAVAADGTIFGKPLIAEKAREQLALSSGNQVIFYTGLALKRGKEIYSTVETFIVNFRELSKEEIENYIKIERPFNCAGSFKSEGLGILLFDSLEGRDPNALIGMPLIALNELFSYFNINLLTDLVGK
ncbi:MAG: septum formation inhibitor Maf [Cardiobacteriaceae bacterium]|nr:septum formation inhibitor Maf [Cardiobacteriaceae bacterium]